MTVPQHAHLFHNRHRLAGQDLAWASRRLAMLDGHHVAKVHARHGVIDGFELSAEGGTAGRLVVQPGTAFTPYGDLVNVPCTTRFAPPDDPGRYDVWLGFDGRVVLDPHRTCRPGNAIYLGSAEAVIWVPYGFDRIRWLTSSPSIAGRPMVMERQRAHVAAGTEQLRLSDLDSIDSVAQTITRRVVTSNGQFERPPLYFASVNVADTFADSVVEGYLEWFVDICQPSSDAFTARVHVHPAWQVVHLVELSNSPNDVVAELTWLGVDPARLDVHPADPSSCTAMPPPPDPEIVF